MSAPSTSAADDDVRLLTIAEVCSRLRISRWTFYQLVNRRQLHTVTIGSRRLVTTTELSRFVAQLEVIAGGRSI